MVTRLRLPAEGHQGVLRDQGAPAQPVWKYVDAISLNLYPTDTSHRARPTRPATPEDSMALLSDGARPAGQGPGPVLDPDLEHRGQLRDGFGGTAARRGADLRGRQVAYVMRTYLLNAAQGVKRVDWYAYDMGMPAAVAARSATPC